MMVIDNKFDIGETVYVRVDENQVSYVMISIRLCPGGSLLYLISGIDEQHWMYDIELSSEPNLVFKTSN